MMASVSSPTSIVPPAFAAVTERRDSATKATEVIAERVIRIVRNRFIESRTRKGGPSRFCPQTRNMTTESQNNALDLIERDLVVAPIVELGRACALVCCHLLGVFEQAAIKQIDGDAGGPEAVAADACQEPD